MDLKSRIDEFAGLEQGWNGYNAPPIPEMVIERSRRFASALKKEAEVFPTGRESIQFEFDNMEIEIFESEVELLQESTFAEDPYECTLNLDEAIDKHTGA